MTAACDANWGPQDQSKPNPSHPVELPIHAPRSISGYIIYLAGGPITWSSKRQTITARSTAESEIYATDECCKHLLFLKKTFNHHNLLHFSQPIDLYNDNMACVLWAKSTTTKGLRHITMRENATRESVHDKTIAIHHVGGKVNTSDLLTKEFGRDPTHFRDLRAATMSQIPTTVPIHTYTPPIAAAAAHVENLPTHNDYLHTSYSVPPHVHINTSGATSSPSLRNTFAWISSSSFANTSRHLLRRLGGVT